MNTSANILLYGGYENMGYFKRKVVIILLANYKVQTIFITLVKELLAL